MLPAKWKVFRIINYLHIAVILVQFAIILYQKLFNTYDSEIDWLFYLVVIPANGILLTNGFIVLYLVEKCYPNKYPGKRLYRLSLAIFIISIVLLSAVVLLTTILFLEMFENQPNFGADKIDLLFFILYIVMSATGFYIFILQTGLWKTIRHNYQSAMDSFLSAEQE